MTNFGVKSVLWRRVLQATIDTLTDDSKGQFHIALTTNKSIPTFFEGSSPHAHPLTLGAARRTTPS